MTTTYSPKRRRVAFALPPGVPFLERVLRGVMDHVRTTDGWSVVRLPELYGSQVHWLKDWSGDGALVLITSQAEARTARSLTLPMVNLATHLEDTDLPTVAVDHAHIGRMAADHLLGRGFRRCAYYGVRGLRYSELRRDAFAAQVTAAGGRCLCFESPSALRAAAVDGHLAALDRWLTSLGPATGILASNDLRAGMVLDACQRLDLRVPQDIAVLGVDNDPSMCRLFDPPLSSVDRNDEEVGRTAARLLDRLMAGFTVPTSTVLIPPTGVVARRSTATHAVDHPLLAAVVLHLDAHLHEPFGVERILDQQTLSRRRIEELFQEHLGCSPYQYILRQRVEQVRLMLDETPDLPVSTIAQRCGFSDLRHLRRTFFRHVGRSLADYRAHQ